MSAAGQTLNDRILAAKHSIAGQGLAKAVCKATTEELIGPKKKHLDYLLHCTNEPNVSIPTLANLLIERTQNPSWIVVFKSLITTHHLMCYGNERFTQYLASSNNNFQLSNFLDKSATQGYDMSPFIRRYAKYLSEKSVSYRMVAFDFCKVKRGKDGGTLRTMNADKLLKTLPVLQQQLDALVDFDCTSQDLTNGVISACFMLLFRDLIRLFACYNDGIINLLEKYFDMNKKQTREALDLYKKFLIRMDRVADFLKVAENVGISKDDIPDLAKAPSSLLEALEGHLASLEGRKPGSGGNTPTGNNRVNVAAAVNALSSTSNAFGTAANNGAIDEKAAQKLLEEEAAAMEKFRSTASASNPFAAAQAAPSQKEETPNILDLFGVSAPAGGEPSAAPAPGPVPAAAAVDPSKASDDLLQLAGNPFANMLNAAGSGANAFPSGVPSAGFPPSGMMGATIQPAAVSSSSGGAQQPFLSDFSSVFGPTTTGNNAFTGGSGGLFGEVLQPSGGSGAAGAGSQQKVITGDLDSSLANLASNLDFGSGKSKGVAGAARGPPMAPMGQQTGFNAFQSQQHQTLSFSSPSGQMPFQQANITRSTTLDTFTSSLQPTPIVTDGSPFNYKSGELPNPLVSMSNSVSFPTSLASAGTGRDLFASMGGGMNSNQHGSADFFEAFNNNNNNNTNSTPVSGSFFGSPTASGFSTANSSSQPQLLTGGNNAAANDPFGLF